MLYSADSMAWSFAARYNGGDRHGLFEALHFKNDIETKKGTTPNQMVLTL